MDKQPSALAAFVRQVGQTIKDVSDSAGAAPIHAALRGGLKDLQDAILPAFPDSMKAREEPGSIASPTQQIVTQQMKDKSADFDMDR
jgi:hypothetical protein